MFGFLRKWPQKTGLYGKVRYGKGEAEKAPYFGAVWRFFCFG